MIATAAVVLNVFHPAVCFREGYERDISIKMKGAKPRNGDGKGVSNMVDA
jgi:hypothetical protein